MNRNACGPLPEGLGGITRSNRKLPPVGSSQGRTPPADANEVMPIIPGSASLVQPLDGKKISLTKQGAVMYTNEHSQCSACSWRVYVQVHDGLRARAVLYAVAFRPPHP